MTHYPENYRAPYDNRQAMPPGVDPDFTMRDRQSGLGPAIVALAILVVLGLGAWAVSDGSPADPAAVGAPMEPAATAPVDPAAAPPATVVE